MSSFMPMRGRKDGRDMDSARGPYASGYQAGSGFLLVPSGALEAQQQQLDGLAAGQFVRESDPNDDASSLMRLISGAASSMGRGGGGGNYPLHTASNNAIPRQFYNQFQTTSAQTDMSNNGPGAVLAHLGARGSPASSRSPASASLEQVADVPVVVRPMVFAPNGGEGGGGGNQIMQAKLRRAFHPMRGKKSQRYDDQSDLFLETATTDES